MLHKTYQGNIKGHLVLPNAMVTNRVRTLTPVVIYAFMVGIALFHSLQMRSSTLF